MSGSGDVPEAYADFAMAKVFGWTPSQVANESVEMLSLWREFLHIEGSAEYIREKRAEQKAKMNYKFSR